MNKIDSNYINIAKTIGGVTIAMVALNFIFAKEYSWVSIFIVLFMAILGIMISYFQYKKDLLLNKTTSSKTSKIKRKKR